MVVSGWTIIDSFELTGLCDSSTSTSGNTYLAGWASSNASDISFLENVYAHGWTATSTAWAVTVIGGGGGVQQVLDHIVIDGSDSNPEEVAWGTYPIFTHMRDSIVRYVGQGVGQACHDIHDNIFEHFYITENAGHVNALECNSDATATTANVFYNNIFRHFDPSFDNGEVVWFCPNGTPEYWFNNLMYDVVGNGEGQPWNIAGPPHYSCSNAGGQFMFNNTLVDVSQPCYLGPDNTTDGQYLTVLNEHLINTPWTTGSPQCSGGPSSATNISMTDATATSQGYTTGSSGTVSTNTCANDTTTPCSPTLASNGTVATGQSEQAYCTALGVYTSEPAIGTDAANACKYGTTDACSYNSTTHAMKCPGQTPVVRPASGAVAWDAGAYVFGDAPAPQPPSNVQATAH
jgi:hypothetical protein